MDMTPGLSIKRDVLLRDAALGLRLEALMRAAMHASSASRASSVRRQVKTCNRASKWYHASGFSYATVMDLHPIWSLVKHTVLWGARALVNH